MHEADDANSIQSAWSRYWMDKFLTQANSTWILSKFSMFAACEVFLVILWQIPGSHWEMPNVNQGNGEWFIPRMIFLLTYSRILVVFGIITWICHLDLSILYLIASCDRYHTWGKRRLLSKNVDCFLELSWLWYGLLLFLEKVCQSISKKQVKSDD